MGTVLTFGRMPTNKLSGPAPLRGLNWAGQRASTRWSAQNSTAQPLACGLRFFIAGRMTGAAPVTSFSFLLVQRRSCPRRRHPFKHPGSGDSGDGARGHCLCLSFDLATRKAVPACVRFGRLNWRGRRGHGEGWSWPFDLGKSGDVHACARFACLGWRGQRRRTHSRTGALETGGAWPWPLRAGKGEASDLFQPRGFGHNRPNRGEVPP